MSSPLMNMWISMHNNYKTELWQYVRSGTPAVTYPTINSIDDITKQFFLDVHAEGEWEAYTKEWNNRRLWGFLAPKPDQHQTIRNDVDMLAAADPNHFAPSGAWHYTDGRSVGTQWAQPDPGGFGDPQYAGKTVVPFKNITGHTLRRMAEDGISPVKFIDLVEDVVVDLMALLAYFNIDLNTFQELFVEDFPVGKLADEILIGDPIYPTQESVINFMPDQPNGDPATEIHDVMLLLGQAPRIFHIVPDP